MIRVLKTNNCGLIETTPGHLHVFYRFKDHLSYASSCNEDNPGLRQNLFDHYQKMRSNEERNLYWEDNCLFIDERK